MDAAESGTYQMAISNQGWFMGEQQQQLDEVDVKFTSSRKPSTRSLPKLLLILWALRSPGQINSLEKLLTANASFSSAPCTLLPKHLDLTTLTLHSSATCLQIRPWAGPHLSGIRAATLLPLTSVSLNYSRESLIIPQMEKKWWRTIWQISRRIN